MSLEPDVSWCHSCAARTRWVLGRGGQHLKCEGCGDRFPCAHACKHLDCQEARAQLGKKVSDKGRAPAATEHDKLAPATTDATPATDWFSDAAAPANEGGGVAESDRADDEKEDTGWG